MESDLNTSVDKSSLAQFTKALQLHLLGLIWTAGLVLAGFAFSGQAHASLLLNSAMLNVASPAQGPASVVYVMGGGTITADVNGSTVGSTNWRGTSWQIGAGPFTCVNTTDFNNNNSTTTLSFPITAPAAAGTYNASFIAYSDNACTSNASNTLVLTGSIVVDNTPPSTSSIVRANANPTSGPSVSWTVTFSESVTGVAAGNFTLVQGGGLSGTVITSVTGSGTTWTVTANIGTGSGTLGLNLTSAAGITDRAGNTLAGVPVTGEVYTVNGSTAATATASPTLCISDPSNGGTYAWGGLTNVGAQDGVYASAGGYNSSVTEYLKCTGYGFSIPAGATITGITVGVWDYSAKTMSDHSMVLVKANANQTGPLGTMDLATNTRFSTTNSQVIYGGATNLWGNTWTATDINSATFGAAFAAVRGPYTTTDTAFVDYMPITVDYTLPAFPTVVSINLASTNPSNPATAVSWTVTFSTSVTGVDSTDFALVQGGGVTGASITGVTGVGATWTVTANTGSGTGTLGLNLVDNDSIIDGSGRKLGGTGAGNGNFTGQVYTISTPLTCITDNFTGADNSAPNSTDWNVGKVSGTFTPVIFGNRLRITDTSSSSATRVTNKNIFPFGNNMVVVEFDYWGYGGTGADGIAITFSDPNTPTTGANNPPTTGVFGGSLGYANRDTAGTCNIPGFTGGWIGVGIDEYGNYSNPTECRNGGPGALPNAVAIRGSGSGATSPSASNYAYLTGTGALGANGVSSGTSGTAYRYRITLDSITNLAKVIVKVEQDKTGTGYVPLFSYDLKPSITAGTQAALPSQLQLTFTGSTGGSTNNHEIDNLSICAASVIPAGGPDHLEIQHASGNGLTCTPSTLKIIACADAACTTAYTGGVNGTLSATGTGMTVNWSGGSSFSIPAGSSTVTKDVQVTTPGSVVFGATSTPSATSATTCNFGSPGCTFTAFDTGFLVSAPNHVAESSSTLTVQAVKKADNSLTCVPAFASTSKTVNLKCAYSNPASGTLPVRIGGTPLNATANGVSACDGTGANVSLIFDATGTATPTLQYADVGQMNVSAAYTGIPGSLDAGLSMIGTGSFIAAPKSFAFSGLPAGPIKAGNPFSVTVSALNNAGAVTPNFGKESLPGPAGVTLTSNLVTPAGGANPAPANNVIPGTEFGAGGMVNDANGVATVNNLNWGEVGSITLTAKLTNTYGYLGTAATPTQDALTNLLIATGTSATVGAFIPDHFDTAVVATATTPMPCPTGLTCPTLYPGFVYSGQPFSEQVTARNLAGGTTTNYHSAYGLSNNVTLSAWDALGSVVTQNPGGGALAINPMLSTAFNSGVGLTNTQAYTFTTSLTSPTDIFLRAVDAVNTSVTSRRATPATSVEGGVKVVSGRIKLSNTHGSELLPIPIVATAQYWNATSGWVTSSTDSVSSFAVGNVVFSNWQKSSPASSWTTGSTSVVTPPASVVFVNGSGSFKLVAPGAGNTGSVDMNINVPSYLPSNTARATFGVYKGANEFIYLRENY